MDVILNQIDEALKKKGYSDAKASRLAVGHPSLIKNFRMKRDGDKRYNWASLERLAEVLDLELYFGPPREAGTVYTTQLGHDDFDVILRLDARLAAGAGVENGEVSYEGALAFCRKWLNEHNISPSQACLMRVSGDSMCPMLRDDDVVMIDQRKTTIRNRHVYALVDVDGSSRVKRVELVENEMIILSSDNPNYPTETRRGPDMNRIRILGEIVWSSHAW
ncbi:S24 family peptidase [Roseovarius sp. 217]|uniref:S24 family peptidase n=1 Tax=Roseovarius sp. (strain 217) TaxID=314264 RepID=UPI000068586D|nr:S24 family peptidase [Roseovarius sp. 217]EAQ27484.1 phage-related protein [Roseovarius sp. 217]